MTTKKIFVYNINRTYFLQNGLGLTKFVKGEEVPEKVSAAFPHTKYFDEKIIEVEQEEVKTKEVPKEVKSENKKYISGNQKKNKK